ncbi:hypothetical protein DPMN_010680 [Dreissena polymorpha]|uniref:Uncharacterized protein n=1 Tax=Dreissena polymorpha TaxID=45954 RepID=A0A9D4MZ65_DREPO|nr:hypothetical protein DPMN_010680 [Dreissena polymorpha]
MSDKVMDWTSLFRPPANIRQSNNQSRDPALWLTWKTNAPLVAITNLGTKRHWTIHTQLLTKLTQLLTKFGEDRTQLLTKFADTAVDAARLPAKGETIIRPVFKNGRIKRKTAPPPDGHFHQDWTINVTPRPYWENCPAPGGHFFQQTATILKLERAIIKTNILIKFHKDWTINVTS